MLITKQLQLTTYTSLKKNIKTERIIMNKIQYKENLWEKKSCRKDLKVRKLIYLLKTVK